MLDMIKVCHANMRAEREERDGERAGEMITIITVHTRRAAAAVCKLIHKPFHCMCVHCVCVLALRDVS